MILKLYCLLVSLCFSSMALAYEIYDVKSFQCRNGKSLGLILATQIGVVAEKDPIYYVKYYCDFNTLKGYSSGIESGPDKRPAQVKNCESESADWQKNCYEVEFKPKCSDGKRVFMKECFEKTMPQGSDGAPGSK